MNTTFCFFPSFVLLGLFFILSSLSYSKGTLMFESTPFQKIYIFPLLVGW